MAVENITTKEDLYTILDNKDIPERYILLDIYANWCNPCMNFAKKFEELAESYKDSIKFLKIDVDTVPAIMEEFNITALPTYLIFNPGERHTTHNPIYGTDKQKIDFQLTKLVGANLSLDNF